MATLKPPPLWCDISLVFMLCLSLLLIAGLGRVTFMSC